MITALNPTLIATWGNDAGYARLLRWWHLFRLCVLAVQVPLRSRLYLTLTFCRSGIDVTAGCSLGIAKLPEVMHTAEVAAGFFGIQTNHTASNYDAQPDSEVFLTATAS